MLLFYYFKEVIHSPVHQSNGESEAANGQWLGGRTSCCISKLPSACWHRLPARTGWDSGMSLL